MKDFLSDADTVLLYPSKSICPDWAVFLGILNFPNKIVQKMCGRFSKIVRGGGAENLPKFVQQLCAERPRTSFTQCWVPPRTIFEEIRPNKFCPIFVGTSKVQETRSCMSHADLNRVFPDGGLADGGLVRREICQRNFENNCT